mmetsp:Transcript_36470/g.91423  ORF Transcript_36470/g.91423 Transcript_36470/m.91423 type:complete len:263 (+) Transcript_36470:34-822(+)
MDAAVDFFWRNVEVIALLAPNVTYWLVSFMFQCVEWAQVPWLERYRVQSTRTLAKNTVTKTRVVLQVLVTQVLQTSVVLVGLYCLGHFDPSFTAEYTWHTSTWLSIALQFCAALLVMDTYQYWLHRYMHENKFLYRHFHSVHHRLYNPYSFGALYNHPVESLLLDALSGVLSTFITGMESNPPVAIFFLCFATAKTVDDHCGYRLPFDPLQVFFPNNAYYHDVHHQTRGIKHNFSQPFFTFWDGLCGTQWDPAEFHSKAAAA